MLFVSFRALALLAFRPGGLILDFSDFYYYREFAQVSRQGYIPYQTMWAPYPPLFHVVMGVIWQISVLLPPWEYNNLIFTLLLGGTFLVFEAGNFILLYLLALKLYPLEQALLPVMIYAGLFVPVYTATGWFENFPIFFLLLSLYLLLENRPYLSAFFSGVGFMIKLIPLILLPVGLRTLPVKARRGRLQLKALNLDLDLKEALIYAGMFAVTILAIGYPFYRMNPDLILRPLQATGARLPWETIWALFDHNYAYGILPDARDISWPLPVGRQSALPWLWIYAAFGLAYAFLYTRRINWQTPRPVIAFTGLTTCLFFLASKGFSPQWLGWVLIFNALLLPNLRGVSYAVLLCIANIIEANVFFMIFPAEHWLLASTILLRTVLLVVLAGEFCLILWPRLETPALIAVRRKAVAIGLVLLALGLIPAGLRLNTAYFETRLAQSPYRATITWLSKQPVTEAILLNNHTVYDWFYPYLRQNHAFYMLDDYPPAETRTAALMEKIAQKHRAVWIYDSDPAQTTPAETAAFAWLGNSAPAHQADIDGGRLYLFILPEAETP